jgi:predicted short-subunit dehydrogenase-like oxidoreductase (DUF2520 family)
MYQESISFAGAGRLASALCKELFSAGFRIDTIVSETEIRGRPLAVSCGAMWSDYLFFPDTTNVVIVAVPDHRLKSILENIKCEPETLIVHTAGSYGLDIFPEHIRKKGIFYPLQTFSNDRKVSFTDLPFLLESSDKESDNVLRRLVESIHGKACFVDAEKRKMLHLAAVFVCNFSNHMLTLGKEISLKTGLAFEILSPLIEETMSKALVLGPENSQTGPAVRHDKNTIEKHLDLLSFSPDLQRIYNEMTISIIKYYNTIN